MLSEKQFAEWCEQYIILSLKKHKMISQVSIMQIWIDKRNLKELEGFKENWWQVFPGRRKDPGDYGRQREIVCICNVQGFLKVIY